MGFSEAIKTVFGKYAEFQGRARRSEYWYWVLFTVVVNIVLTSIDRAIFGVDENGISRSVLSGIFGLAVLVPGLAVTVRRLHDVGKSGWWVLLNLIFLIGSLILIFAFLIKDSQPGTNQFGDNPKGVGNLDPSIAYQAYGQPGYDPQNPYAQPGQQPDPYAQPSGQPGPYAQQPYSPQPPQEPYSPQPPQDPYGQQPQNPYGRPPQQ